MKIAIVGATGETGRSIVAGLLKSGNEYEIKALIRPSSIQKPKTQEMEKLGLEVVAADLQGPQEDLVKILTGVDVVISAIYFQALSEEIPLASAAKIAEVKRYIPCWWGTTAARGVMRLHDAKEEILDHVKSLNLPYTAIAVGWWYQSIFPRVPSGRMDYAIVNFANTNTILDGGKVPVALTDLSDIGLYTEKIIRDPRTLNRLVFAYTEVKTQTEVFELTERLSGEKLARIELSKAEIEETIVKMRKESSPLLPVYEYWNSWGVRGDNCPEQAKQLGYLLAEDLYPGVKGKSLEAFCQDILDGKGVAPYQGESPLQKN